MEVFVPERKSMSKKETARVVENFFGLYVHVRDVTLKTPLILSLSKNKFQLHVQFTFRFVLYGAIRGACVIICEEN